MKKQIGKNLMQKWKNKIRVRLSALDKKKLVDGLASAVMVGVRSSVTTTESSRRNLPKDSRKRPRGGVRYL